MKQILLVFVFIFAITCLNEKAEGVSVPFMNAIYLKKLLNSSDPKIRKQGTSFIIGVANGFIIATSETCKSEIDISYNQLITEVTKLLDFVPPKPGQMAFSPIAYVLEDLTMCEMVPPAN